VTLNPDVDGVGYRMVASKTPISKGAKGSSALYVVKAVWRSPAVRRAPIGQRNALVVHGAIRTRRHTRRAGPVRGAPPHQQIRVTKPAANVEGGSKDKIDTLSDQIIVHLRETTGGFETVNKLADALRAAGVHITKADMAPALQRLANRELIEWPDVPDRKPRPGWLR
jgi:hypothetical protein